MQCKEGGEGQLSAPDWPSSLLVPIALQETIAKQKSTFKFERVKSNFLSPVCSSNPKISAHGEKQTTYLLQWMWKFDLRYPLIDSPSSPNGLPLTSPHYLSSDSPTQPISMSRLFCRCSPGDQLKSNWALTHFLLPYWSANILLSGHKNALTVIMRSKVACKDFYCCPSFLFCCCCFFN